MKKWSHGQIHDANLNFEANTYFAATTSNECKFSRNIVRQKVLSSICVYEKLVALAVTEGSSLICLRSSKIQTIFRIEYHLVVEEDK